jgi:hypothetical protein
MCVEIDEMQKFCESRSYLDTGRRKLVRRGQCSGVKVKY